MPGPMGRRRRPPRTLGGGVPGSLVGESVRRPRGAGPHGPAPPDRATRLCSDRFLARSVAQPINRFLHIEASGGLLLAAAAVIALLWANSPWASSYRDLWATDITLDFGVHTIMEDLRHWINDGLMTLFFFVIGLEINEELTNGQLAEPRDAAVPAAGALGGMIVPALLSWPSTSAVRAPAARASRWPPTSLSPSASSPSSAAAYPRN